MSDYICRGCADQFYVELTDDVADHGLCWPCASKALDLAPTTDDIEILRLEIDAALERTQKTREERDRLRAAIWSVIDTFEGAVRAFESRGAGGQHVPYHGDFSSVTPSTVSQMRRWIRDLRCALKNEWPMLRHEFVAMYPHIDAAALDEMFKDRECK